MKMMINAVQEGRITQETCRLYVGRLKRAIVRFNRKQRAADEDETWPAIVTAAGISWRHGDCGYYTAEVAGELLTVNVAYCAGISWRYGNCAVRCMAEAKIST